MINCTGFLRKIKIINNIITQNMKNDFSVAIKYFDLYYFLAKQDLKSRFRRSYLGISWIVIHQLVFSLVAGLIWSRIFGFKASTFIPFLTIGSVSWNYLAAALVDGCGTFVVAHVYLKQLALPQSIFTFRTLLTASFYFCVGICTAIFILILFGKLSITGLIYTIPGFAILILYFYSASGAMAYLGLRYRDLQHALSSFLSLLFIATPVIYPPEILIQKGIGMIIYLNPFASLIEVVRYPLLHGEFANNQSYIISLVFISCIAGLRSFLQNKWRRFVPFWA